jgi:hypothetical protein
VKNAKARNKGKRHVEGHATSTPIPQQCLDEHPTAGGKLLFFLTPDATNVLVKIGSKVKTTPFHNFLFIKIVLIGM